MVSGNEQAFGEGKFEMQNISAAWLYPIILIAGALQAWGPDRP
jgi:hypothetical protein